MNRSPFSWLLFAVLLIGVFNMDAAESASQFDWVPIKDEKEGFEATFPGHPIKMEFDVPMEHTDRLAKLAVYSVPAEKGLFMLASLDSPSFTGSELEEERLPRVLYAYILQRMFYHPKAFQQGAAYSQNQIEFQGMPAVRFTWTFQEEELHDRHVSGLALFHEGKLYVLFNLVPSVHFQFDTLEKFLKSFHPF